MKFLYWTSLTFTSLLSLYFYYLYKKEKRKRIKNDITDLIGHTPLMLLPKLSKQLNTKIYVKCEFLNPGGSTKDRIVYSILKELKEKKKINSETTIYEGTVGSTGIALAWLCQYYKLKCHICIPDDQSTEKYQVLDSLGAHIEKVKPLSIIDDGQFTKLAKKRAQEDPNGIFLDQFENLGNFWCHFRGTGPEIYEDTEGTIEAFVMGAGTGGTLAGCARYLKKKNPDIRIFLADPQGSGLGNKVNHDVMFSKEEREGTRKRHQVDTIVEGIGLNRLTNNLSMILGKGKWIWDEEEAVQTIQNGLNVDKSSPPFRWVDQAIKVSDQEALEMSKWLLENEGLFLGSSSAVNIRAAVKLAKQNPDLKCIVTLACDAGYRHLSKFWKR